jgi:hypothetical protein
LTPSTTNIFVLSFITAEAIFAARPDPFDVDERPTRVLRIYARHAEDRSKSVGQRVADLRNRARQGLTRLGITAISPARTKRKLLEFLIQAKRAGKSIAGYGAPGKGNTLLNYCGIRTDFLDYTVDRNPYKQGKFLPGTHIPIFSPKGSGDGRLCIDPALELKDEIMAQMAFIREWGPVRCTHSWWVYA